MGWVGVGFRRELAAWIDARPHSIECVEVTAEHFFDSGANILQALTRDYPVFVHGLGLSLGTPGPLDENSLERFAEVVRVAEPEWISEHVAFTHSNELDLGHLNPIRPSRETVQVIANHARHLAEICNKPILLENITSYLQLDGEMSEPAFLNQVCRESACGLLLDVTNLFINSRNHKFDPRKWLHELDPRLIVQLHVVGYSERAGQLHDFHAESIQDDLRTLIHDVLDFAPVQAITLERDTNFPSPGELDNELRQLRKALDQHRPHNRASSTS